MSVKQRCRHCKEYVEQLSKHECGGNPIEGDNSIAGRTAQIGAIRNSGFNQAKYPHGMNPKQWWHELAKEAMKAMIGNSSIFTEQHFVHLDSDRSSVKENIADRAYIIADAMLKEGDKNE